MYCKYCGKPIDEGTMRCRICGRPVGPLEGGNGFWDLAAEKSAGAASDPNAAAVSAAADEVALGKLQTELAQLRREVELHPAQKRSALPVLASLLALLALAVGVFGLYQLQVLTGRLQSVDRRVNELGAAVAAAEQERAEALEAETKPGGEDTAGETKWRGTYELEGIPLQPALNLFVGPNKGDNDERGQSINLGEPADGGELTTIFTARFVGPPGTYQYCWVRVETDEETDLTYFTPIREENEEGLLTVRPKPSDKDKTFMLFIEGAVTKEHLGRYAFVVVDMQTRSAYVSQIVELYDRAEQGRSEATGEANGG